MNLDSPLIGFQKVDHDIPKKHPDRRHIRWPHLPIETLLVKMQNAINLIAPNLSGCTPHLSDAPRQRQIARSRVIENH